MPIAPPPIEGALKRFELSMLALFKNKNKPKNTNLTKLQQNFLHYFTNHPEHVILQADKNLGPCVMNREDYISQCMKHHLSNEKCYKRISEEVPRAYINNSMEEFFEHVQQPGLEINNKDLAYLKEAAEIWTGMANFYCLPKVHNKKHPIPMRPVVGACGTPLFALGKWATHVMKPVTMQTSTYVRDSDEFIQNLKELGEIEDNESLFTSDAMAMNPNIQTEEAVAALTLAYETDLLQFGDAFPIRQLTIVSW